MTEKHVTGCVKRELWRLQCHTATYTETLVAQQPPYLSLWQFYTELCREEYTIQVFTSQNSFLPSPYSPCTPLLCICVCICMCLCLCKTDCTSPQCSQWPPRPSAPLCIVLFLPSVEVTDLAPGPFGEGSDSPAESW